MIEQAVLPLLAQSQITMWKGQLLNWLIVQHVANNLSLASFSLFLFLLPRLYSKTPVQVIVHFICDVLCPQHVYQTEHTLFHGPPDSSTHLWLCVQSCSLWVCLLLECVPQCPTSCYSFTPLGAVFLCSHFPRDLFRLMQMCNYVHDKVVKYNMRNWKLQER